MYAVIPAPGRNVGGGGCTGDTGGFASASSACLFQSITAVSGESAAAPRGTPLASATIASSASRTNAATRPGLGRAVLMLLMTTPSQGVPALMSNRSSDDYGRVSTALVPSLEVSAGRDVDVAAPLGAGCASEEELLPV